MAENTKKPIPLRTQIFEKLKSRIEMNEWEVGGKLPSESQLGAEYKVSRVTIRAAIQQLEAIGLIKTQQGGRTRVLRTNTNDMASSLSPFASPTEHTDIIQVLEYRMVVEKGTIGLAVQRITEDDLAEFEEIFNMMLVHHDNTKKFSKADYLFHRKIAQTSRNPILIHANESIEAVLSSAMDKIVIILGCSIGIQYHRLLLAAMRRRDKLACEQLMEEHLQATIDGVKNFLEKSVEL